MPSPEKIVLKNDEKSTIFYRKAYFEVESTLRQVPFITLVGPRSVGKTTILLQLKNKYGGNYISFKGLSEEESDKQFQEIVNRLRRNEQTIEYLDEITYLDDFFHGVTDKWGTADDFLKMYNPSFCNAQFLMCILEELVSSLQGISVMDLLDRSLLGSIVECCIRGSINAWSGTDNVELHDENHAEVDCIVGDYAIEISTRNKQLSEIHFKAFNEIKDYQKILLTEDVLNTEEEIWRIPYYVFQAHLDLAGAMIDL